MLAASLSPASVHILFYFSVNSNPNIWIFIINAHSSSTWYFSCADIPSYRYLLAVGSFFGFRRSGAELISLAPLFWFHSASALFLSLSKSVIFFTLTVFFAEVRFRCCGSSPASFSRPTSGPFLTHWSALPLLRSFLPWQYCFVLLFWLSFSLTIFSFPSILF